MGLIILKIIIIMIICFIPIIIICYLCSDTTSRDIDNAKMDKVLEDLKMKNKGRII